MAASASGRSCCGGACGEDTIRTGSVLRIAAGLELIQTCALVHDDVMDGSPLRRGRPAVHTDFDQRYGELAHPSPVARPGVAISFGTAAAVLFGDLALAWADDTVADALAEADLAPEARRRVRGVWQAMRTEMVAGQYLDLHSQVTGSRSAARDAGLVHRLGEDALQRGEAGFVDDHYGDAFQKGPDGWCARPGPATGQRSRGRE